MASLKDLENAAQTIFGTQSPVSHEDRQKAEEVLLSFRRSSPPFHVCKELLENCKEEPIQFQAASALKDAVIREWAGMEEDTRNSLQEFILLYASNNQNTSHFVKEILAQVLAVMVKMKTVQAKGIEHRQPVYTYLSSLILSGDEKQQLLACSILSALLTEFSLTNRSSSVGLTWDTHGHCKKAFESSDLKIIFGLILDVLKHIAAFEKNNSIFLETNGLCRKFLTIAEQTVSWNFTSTLLTRRSMILQAEEELVLFRPPSEWKVILLDPVNIQAFFSISRNCRENEELSRLSVSCLAQLATLQGPVLKSLEDKCRFLMLFVPCFLHVYNNSCILDHEALGVASICKNIVEVHGLEPWSCSHDLQHLFQQFLYCLTELTCNIMGGAAKEEAEDSDDHLYMESFESILDSWTTLVLSVSGPKDFIAPSAVRIFEMFVHCHISPPDGSRSLPDDSDVDIDEIEEDDHVRFYGQLMSVSCLGRISPHNSLTVLSTSLEKRVETLYQKLKTCHCEGSDLNPVSMVELFEDMHWLVLLAGHVLADDLESETPVIPAEIIQCSVSLRNQVDENLSLWFLGSPHEDIGIVSSSVQHIDPVIRLVSTVLRLCEANLDAIRSTMFGSLSPQLVRDVLWFFRTWSRSYLFFNEEYYDEVSPVLCAAFGPDSEGGRWVVNYILKAACTILTNCSSETKLMEDAAGMLTVLLESEKRCSVVAVSGDFWKLGHDVCNGNPLYDHFAPTIRRAIMSSVVVAGSSNMNMYHEKYWEQTMNLIKARYTAVTSSQDFKDNALDTRVKESILSILDLLRGISEASCVANSLLLFNYLSEILADGSNIMYTYRNCQAVVVSVLELFAEVSHKQICYLPDEKCHLLYEWTLALLRTFPAISTSVRSVEAEEDSFEDLSLVIELLTNLLNRDFIDFSESATDLHTEVTIRPAENQVSVADVVFYGLGIVLPYINTDLLAYPSLCCQYFKLVTFLCEIYPEKIEKLPSDIFSAFMCSLELGLKSYGDDNCKLCLEALLALADQCDGTASSPLLAALQPFTKMVFDTILMHAADMELLRTAGDTFHSMFHMDQKQIMDLLSSVVEQQQDPSNKTQLEREFRKLFPPQHLAWKANRNDKARFIKVLEAVVFNVRGILYIK